MEIKSTRTPGSAWAARLGTGRALTVTGVCAGTLRVSVEQLTGQAATRACHDVARLLECIPVSRIPHSDGVLAWFHALPDFADVAPVHLLVVLLTAMCPVGGSVWAGVIPVGMSVRGMRAGSESLHRAVRNAAVRPRPFALRGVAAFIVARSHGWLVGTPASRNVRRTMSCQPDDMGLTVLIVDDNADFRDVARRLLERGGLTVVGVAATIAEALALVEALNPRVVLADIHLGGESGFDVARRLESRDDADRPSVVLMSTHSEEEFADLIAASPAAGFVPKVRLTAEAIVACMDSRSSG